MGECYACVCKNTSTALDLVTIIERIISNGINVYNIKINEESNDSILSLNISLFLFYNSNRLLQSLTRKLIVMSFFELILLII